MMPERYRYWIVVAIVVALALCTLQPLAAAVPGRAEQRELDHAESLLRQWLTSLPPNSGVAIVREDARVMLRFSTSLVFDPDSTGPQAEALNQLPLSAAVRLLKRRRALSAQIVVYTDNIGGSSANQSFSAARAKALCASLIAAGIAAPRLHQRGAGSADPISNNGTPEGRAENRRVEISFAGSAG
jgi:outer membrane protein OmpA-like peptidoglycan-associated protein